MYVELFEKSTTRLITINYDNTGKLVKVLSFVIYKM